jgi:predicted dinucleotide-binding enzyme
MTDKLTVSVLGTGIMGAAMARNLVRADRCRSGADPAICVSRVRIRPRRRGRSSTSRTRGTASRSSGGVVHQGRSAALRTVRP